MTTLLLSNPRGLCAGVERALNIVELALQGFPAPIYVRHEIVHNRYLVQNLKKRGVIFIEEIDEVPDNSVVIFSAHGVSSKVEEQAHTRGLTVLDSTCPLVTKVHIQVARISSLGKECILIGHNGHPEVEGTLGRFNTSHGGEIYLVENITDVNNLQVTNAKNLHYVSQTTLSQDETSEIIEALQKRFPAIQGPKRNDICYATQNRQNAVKELCEKIDLLVVVGSENSSNSQRLKEIGRQNGIDSFLVDDPELVTQEIFKGAKNIGLTAGASAPPTLVNKIIEQICALTDATLREMSGPEEKVHFRMPRNVKKLQQILASENEPLQN